MKGPTEQEIQQRVRENEELHSKEAVDPRSVWEFVAELQLKVEALERRGIFRRIFG